MKSLLRYFLARPTTTAAFATPIYTITRLRQFSKFRETATSRFYTSEAGNNAISSGADPAAPRTPTTPKLPPPCPNELRNLPSQQESRRSVVSKRFSQAMDDLQTAVFTAGQKLNILTGYSDIESLKKAIEAQEKHVRESRLAVRQAKEDYQNAINRRSASQREVNELLQRKHAWSSTDLERFTQLYRSDHTNEQQEVAAQERLATAESTADEAQTQLARSILARYHEEQIWSDKIRRASTWGTWGLMGFNVLLFIVVQLGLEPWKRKRLVGGFEEKVREVIQEETRRNEPHNVQASPRRSTVENIWGSPGVSAAPLESTTDISKDLLDRVAIEQWTHDDTNPELESEDIVNREGKFLAKQALLSHSEDIEHSIGSIKQKVMEFLSETEVTVTQKELTKIAAQSAALGVLLTALVSFFITKR